MTRLDKHDKTMHELFDEDIAQVGSVGDMVEEHAGDAVFLTPKEPSVNGVDSGLTDFASEMLETDPAGREQINPADFYSARDEDEVWSTDQTGTVTGIARGFGTHMAQDLGRDGFHVEEIPDQALQFLGRPIAEGEELDDYDDDNQEETDELDGYVDSQPGANDVDEDDYTEEEPTPDRIHVRTTRARSADDELDGLR